MIKPDVKDKMSRLLRMEPNEICDATTKKTLFRRKLKTILFFAVDIGMLLICIVSLVVLHKEWSECHYHFNAWISVLILFCFLCLIVDTIDYCMLV